MIIEINENLSLNPFQVTSANYLNGSWAVKTTSGEIFQLTPKEYMILDDYGFDLKFLIGRLIDSNAKDD
tara:strand:+ start:681 stop:887 length:207 start_codon:yes stop_codon:yes gene_type:complete